MLARNAIGLQDLLLIIICWDNWTISYRLYNVFTLTYLIVLVIVIWLRAILFLAA